MVPGGAGHRPAVQSIVAGITVELVVVGITAQAIVAVLTPEVVGTGLAEHEVVPRPGKDGVGLPLAVEVVETLLAVEDCVPASPNTTSLP